MIMFAFNIENLGRACKLLLNWSQECIINK